MTRREFDEWDILNSIAKLSVAKVFFTIFVESAQKRSKLPIFHEIVEKESIFFRILWLVFGVLSAGWATIGSTIVSCIVYNIVTSVLNTFVHANTPVGGQLLSVVLGIGQYVLIIYVLLVYRKKFIYYHAWIKRNKQ